MNYNYALIVDNIVSNIIVLHPGNAASFPNAVPVNDYPVFIGDTYDGEHFYRDGEQLKTTQQLLAEDNQQLVAAFAVLGLDVYNMEDTPNE